MVLRFLPLLVLTLFACDPAPKNQSTPNQNKKVDSNTVQTQVTENALIFDTYCNVRFDYCIQYPKEIVYPQPESENGDGRVFKNKQGDVVLTVFGRMNSNAEGETISL